MQGYEEIRGALGEAALKMRFALLAMGLLPLFYLAIEFFFLVEIDKEALRGLRASFPWLPIVLVFAAIAIFSVTLAPRFFCGVMLRNRFSEGFNTSTGDLGGMIILFPALATTPAELGLILFFLVNIYITLPFHLLSLVFLWRFNLSLDSFLDGMAKDITILGEG